MFTTRTVPGDWDALRVREKGERGVGRRRETREEKVPYGKEWGVNKGKEGDR